MKRTLITFLLTVPAFAIDGFVINANGVHGLSFNRARVPNGDTIRPVKMADYTNSCIGSMPSSTRYCGTPAPSKMRTRPTSRPAFL